ncbi:MAG: hypothetical protein D6698_12455 [Gammaproteobacteria bacterium]|nr:MAG: hypothetical protein D6698_12455 [Gammaproteobacteria bacterium]
MIYREAIQDLLSDIDTMTALRDAVMAGHGRNQRAAIIADWILHLYEIEDPNMSDLAVWLEGIYSAVLKSK